MTREEALRRIKTLRDEINAHDDREEEQDWVNNVCWFLDLAGDVIELPVSGNWRDYVK